MSAAGSASVPPRSRRGDGGGFTGKIYPVDSKYDELGSAFAEVPRNVTCRVAPFDTGVAREMLDELRGRAVFDGVRGGGPLDVAADALVAPA